MSRLHSFTHSTILQRICGQKRAYGSYLAKRSPLSRDRIKNRAALALNPPHHTYSTVMQDLSWNRLIRFVAVEDGREYYGQPIDDNLDVGLAIHNGKPVKANIISANSPLDPHAAVTSDVLTVSKLLSPIKRNEISGVRAIGLNFTDHAKEMGFPIPNVPTMFLKARTAVTDPNSLVRVPPAAMDHIDYEVELAVVLAKDCRDVSPEQALEYVLGYTLANDLTSRNHQSLTSQWSHCKSFDAFCPIGPVLVSARHLTDPNSISLSTRLSSQPMGARPLQDGNTKNWIFPIAQAMSYLSQGCTLEAGTVLLTGTPAGIGAGYNPPVWIQHGDVAFLQASHGLGTLVNTFSFERRKLVSVAH